MSHPTVSLCDFPLIIMQAPPPRPDECACNPTPHTWPQVPLDDKPRLNRILRKWQEVARIQASPGQDIVYDIELDILANKTYEWRIFLCPGVCIYAEMLTPMMNEPNVINAEVRMREEGSKNHTHSPLCISVSSMERDQETGGQTHCAPVAPSLDGRSYTQQALEQHHEALADAAAAASIISDETYL